MEAQGSSNLAYGKEVFLQTYRAAAAKVNLTTIKAHGAESFQLVKERLKTIDWADVKAQMKDFNLELAKPAQQASKEGVKAYLRSTFTIEGPQVTDELDGFNQYNSLCFWWGSLESLLSILVTGPFFLLNILGGYLTAMVLWSIYNKSNSKKWMFVGLTGIMFYSCWVIIQIFTTLITVILPLIFGIKLFLTVGMLKYAVALESKAASDMPKAATGPYSQLRDETPGGDVGDSEML